MTEFGNIWNILVNYALKHNKLRTSTTVNSFETAVDIARQLGIEVVYSVKLNNIIHSLSARYETIILKKNFT